MTPKLRRGAALFWGLILLDCALLFWLGYLVGSRPANAGTVLVVACLGASLFLIGMLAGLTRSRVLLVYEIGRGVGLREGLEAQARASAAREAYEEPRE